MTVLMSIPRVATEAIAPKRCHDENKVNRADCKHAGNCDTRAECLALRHAFWRRTCAAGPEESEDGDNEEDDGPGEPDGGRGEEDPDVPEYIGLSALGILCPARSLLHPLHRTKAQDERAAINCDVVVSEET